MTFLLEFFPLEYFAVFWPHADCPCHCQVYNAGLVDARAQLRFAELPAGARVLERSGLLGREAVAEAPWSVAEWAVAPRFDNPRATVPVLVLGFQTP